MAKKYIEGYKIIRNIGTGGYGEVFLVEKGSQRYALKLLKTAEPGVKERFLKEAIKVNELKIEYGMEYVVEIIEILRGGEAYVMEYLPEGSFEYYSRTGDDSFLVKLIHAVAQLHRLGIAHRDLKPENIRARGSTPVILDFGIASWQDSVSKLFGIGTPCYIPPEYWTGENSTPLSRKAAAQLIKIPPANDFKARAKNAKKLHDVYSLGLTIGALLTGSNPPTCSSEEHKIEYLRVGSSFLEPWIRSLPHKFQGFVRDATAFFPLERPYLPQLIERYFPEVPKALTILPEGVKEISSGEIPYICLNCGLSTEPPANFCANCGAPLKYIALHLMPNQSISVSNLPQGVSFLPSSSRHVNFSYPTLLIDLNAPDFSLTIGRIDGNVIFPEDWWMSRKHGTIIKKEKKVFYQDGVEGRPPSNPSKYNSMPVGNSLVPLEAGGYLIIGSTVASIEKYFGEI